ncbi:MAG: hypothetical protein KJ737_12530 [Proteobacteria bacterium]|nr:hypothetical protein [Pseudomonadota bacterium]
MLKAESKDVYQAYLDRYTVKPDVELIKTFRIVIDLYRKYHNLPEEKTHLGIGDIRYDGETALIPVIKKGNVLATIQLSSDTGFEGALKALDQLFDIIDGKKSYGLIPSQRGTYWMGQYKAIMNQFHMVDSLPIVEGLSELERLWQKEGSDSRLLLAAARGYALLYMSLYPDLMKYARDFTSYALGFLALARHIDLGISSVREEAFIAMIMGYTAYAEALLKNSASESKEPTDEIVDAYMRKDFTALNALQGEGSRVLSYYFLTRLYREGGLYREAEDIAKDVLTRFSDHHPAAVEAIYSADLRIAQILTILYPMDILAHMEQNVSPETFTSRDAWMERAKAFAGDPSTGSGISFLQFENLVSAWQPFRGNEKYALFIDVERVKSVYRALYSGAAYLRFHMLFNRLSQMENAENYVQAISEGNDTFPLTMLMKAQLLNGLGDISQAETICEKIVRLPEINFLLAWKAFLCVDNHQTKLRLAPYVLKKLDSHPGTLSCMGNVCQWIYQFDRAETLYSRALKKDPFEFLNYHSLSQVTGSPKPVEDALKKFSYNFPFLEEAGDYYAKQGDIVSRYNAMACYDKAIKLAPSRHDLWKQKSRMLKELNRYDESISVLKEWIDKFGRKDLTTTTFKAELASRYLDIEKPDAALAVLSDEVDSYQGGFMMILAKTYEALGRLEDAKKIYKKAFDRYPTTNHILSGNAAFMWRCGAYDEAADYIAKGRKLNDQFSRWYFNDFMKVFASETVEKIMQALVPLVAKGAGVWERRALAFRFEKEKRPEIAYKVMTTLEPANPMQKFENTVNVYKIVRNWKGEDQARKVLTPYFSPQLNGPLSMILFKEGLFDLLLSGLKEPNGYQQPYREFMWLMKLMAWQANGKPEEYLPEFADHYNENSSDYYHAIGRYILGSLSQPELLNFIRNSKQLCEFAYYIGFFERMKGNFPEAANWYQISLETGLSNNGEYHWASDELFWWAHMGTANRHKIVSEDIRAYHDTLSGE